jgi:hypothetical protein
VTTTIDRRGRPNVAERVERTNEAVRPCLIVEEGQLDAADMGLR